MGKAPDIRERIFGKNPRRRITAVLIAETKGVLSGIERARKLMEGLGLRFESDLKDGNTINAEQEVARVTGNPIQIARAEEQIIGTLSKSSGIATAARQARFQAGPDCQVVSGGWKKMPLEIKDLVRAAVRDGGIDVRISHEPFVYLDKNYVRILGGISEAVRLASSLGGTIVVQIRGETGLVENEAVQAARARADVVMVDTGHQEDLATVSQALLDRGLRSKVRIAFAGNIGLDELESLVRMDVDVVDIGYAILDAPCLAMRFDVIEA